MSSTEAGNRLMIWPLQHHGLWSYFSLSSAALALFLHTLIIYQNNESSIHTMNWIQWWFYKQEDQVKSLV